MWNKCDFYWRGGRWFSRQSQVFKSSDNKIVGRDANLIKLVFFLTVLYLFSFFLVIQFSSDFKILTLSYWFFGIYYTQLRNHPRANSLQQYKFSCDVLIRILSYFVFAFYCIQLMHYPYGFPTTVMLGRFPKYLCCILPRPQMNSWQFALSKLLQIYYLLSTQ